MASCLQSYGQFDVEHVILENDGLVQCRVVDMDGDGDLDVVSTSDYFGDDLSKISWYEQLSNGEYADEVVITTEVAGVVNVEFADLDSDGDLDLISASNSDHKVAWYENLDGSSFGPQIILDQTVGGARSVFTGDMDWDGDLDIVAAASFNDEIVWFENLGTSIFSDKEIIPTVHDYPLIIDIADIDGDGYDDLVVHSTSYYHLSWIKSLGEGEFGSDQMVYDSMAGTGDLRVADMDEDGDLDVLAQHASGNTGAWYENLGNGVFSDDISIPVLYDIDAVYAADMDNDGDNDILVYKSDDDLMYWSENLGSGSFDPLTLEPIADLGTYLSELIIEDYDGDGDVDMLCGTRANSRITWWENDGSQAFPSQEVVTKTAEEAQGVCASDLDGDGDLDLISASHTFSSVTWYENLGDEVYSQGIMIGSEQFEATSVWPADMDGDGDSDILATSTTHHAVFWIENLGGQTFSSLNLIGSGISGVGSVRSADFDLDGDQDVVACSWDSLLMWYENLGGGEFEDYFLSGNVTGSSMVIPADLNGDGLEDIVVDNGGTQDNIRWMENLGDGQFSDLYILFSSDWEASGIDVGDVDGDGDLDVMAASKYSFARDAFWYENDGNGTFTAEHMLPSSALQPYKVALSDVDLDGDLDAIASEATSTTQWDDIHWFENTGNGTFSESQTITFGEDQIKWLLPIDLDADGDEDFLWTASSKDKIAWFENVTLNACPGDLNGDGMMNTQDVLAFLNGFGCSVDCEMDLTGDGLVNIADLLIFLQMFSDGC